MRQHCHLVQVMSSLCHAPVGHAVKPCLTPIPVSGPFDHVGIDVLQLPKSSRGNQYAVVFMDYLTKWPEVFAAMDQTALTIAKLLVEKLLVGMVYPWNFYRIVGISSSPDFSKRYTDGWVPTR